MIVVELRSYEPGLNEPIAHLFAQEGFLRSPDYLEWIFSPPGRPGVVAIARDTSRGGKIIGVLGLVPTTIQCSDATLDSHLAIDLVVDGSYRGKGVFMSLGRLALDWSVKSGAQVVWGFPNQSAAHAWFNHFGWGNLGPVPLMVRPLRTGFMLGRAMTSLAKVDIPLVRSHAINDGFREVTRFGPEMDRLWHAFARRAGCCAVRDARSLNWRIFDRPGEEYRTVASFGRSGTMNALVCSRMERRHGINIFFILEAMSDGQDADQSLLNLLRHELAFAYGCGADAAFCWSPRSAPNRHVYRRASFFPVPECLRPTRSFFGVKPVPALEPMLSRNWYVSYLDLDVL